jgi:hypothetical protein
MNNSCNLISILWKPSAAYRLWALSSFHGKVTLGQNAMLVYISDQDPTSATRLFAFFDPRSDGQRNWSLPACSIRRICRPTFVAISPRNPLLLSKETGFSGQLQ